MHMIDMTTGKAAIAYVGDTPWHGLGYEMQDDQPIEVWREAAGLNYDVLSAPVLFTPEGSTPKTFKDRRVLYRSDNAKPFAVVSGRYKVVQPEAVLKFFDELSRKNGFKLETAGALNHGRRIWALARAGDGEAVVGQDEVRPYVLLATSYDGTMATVAKFTSVRVVCQNTLAMSIGMDGKGGEADTESTGRVSVPHFRTFDADEVRLELGIVRSEFERFMVGARKLSKQRVNTAFATEFLRELLPDAVSVTTSKGGVKMVQPKPIEETKGFQQIMTLFQGEAMGASMKEANGTAWGLLNAITQHVDWQRGRTADTRMASAWFGPGEALKNKARDLLLDVVS